MAVIGLGGGDIRADCAVSQKQSTRSPNGAIVFFSALVFVVVGVAMHGSAVKKVKETLRELHEGEGED